MKPTARQIANEARWALERESTSAEERRTIEDMDKPRATPEQIQEIGDRIDGVTAMYRALSASYERKRRMDEAATEVIESILGRLHG